MNKTLLALALAAAWGPVQAAAVTDGSMGAVQSLSGNFTVPQSLGQLKGNNLFHSFGSFSIGASESATFLSGATVQNVIARVTGSEASLLQGLLALKAAGGARPDFFLINPNGITVTGGARFDLPAGLHLGAAAQLRFADGSTWSASGGSGSTLSVAAPEHFGFLGGEGALRWRGADLQLSSGATLALAGGQVAVDNAVLLAPDGQVQLLSPGRIDLTQGAILAATATTAAGAGRIDVQAQDLSIVGAAGVRTGLLVQTGTLARGRGLTVTLGGTLTMDQGAEITNQGGSPTDNGATRVSAQSASLSAGGLFTTISSESYGSAAGPALQLQLAGPLDLQGGDISSFTVSGSGSAGAIDVQSASIRLDGLGSFALGGIGSFGVSTAPGPVSVTAAGPLTLVNGGHINSSNRSAVDAPPVDVLADSITLDGSTRAATIGSLSQGEGRGASVLVVANGTLTMQPGGQVQAGTFGRGAAGDIGVVARTVEMQGSHPAGTTTGIFNSALANDSGPGGTIEVLANRIDMKGDAGISTSTLNSASGAGSISVQADSLHIDGQGLAGGIQSFAYGSTGDAGVVQVSISGKLDLLAGGSIMAGTLGRGAPGTLLVQAGELLIDGRGAPRLVTGILGDSIEVEGRRGTGASLAVQAGRIAILEGGAISTSTNTEFDAGSVSILAESIVVDGGRNPLTSTGITAITGGAGRAGTITIETGSLDVVDGGLVSTSTVASGRGGALSIQADSLTVARGGVIASVASDSGNAGAVEFRVRGDIRLVDGGVVAASSAGNGAAGRVSIQAGTLTMSGFEPGSGQPSRIASRALPNSSGDAGSIAIQVDGAFVMGPDSLISIANDARVPDGAVFSPSFVRVQAGSIRMTGAEINASASLNADAGAIGLQSAAEVKLSDSTLRTSAHNGAGGPIAISATDVVTLRNTAVTTSVDGVQGGDGGNIRIAGSALVLASGFVQANTVAAKASGGNVTIDVPLLVPDGSNVFIGGNRIAQFRANTPGFNVIQAAAPNGLAGTLDVTTPDLNLSGTLAALSTTRIDFGLLGRDVCQIGFDSSFTPLGRGALPEPASAPLRLRGN